MRITVATLALLALVSAAGAEPPVPAATPSTVPNGPAPRVQVEKPSHHAGKVDQGTMVRHSFLVKNIGTAELSVDAKPG